MCPFNTCMLPFFHICHKNKKSLDGWREGWTRANLELGHITIQRTVSTNSLGSDVPCPPTPADLTLNPLLLIF